MELTAEPLSPGRAVAEVCSVTKPLVEQKRLRVTTEVAPGLSTVYLDPLRFKQILYNLVSNAVKFTDQDGQVSISVAPYNEHFFVTRVTDTGIGISPADLPRLFREFEQLDAGPGRRFEGSGLGLSLTKKLVELHGGTIEVSSEVGKGTTFTVMLPTHFNGTTETGGVANGATA
jgi:signal transduction histidine kinase